MRAPLRFQELQREVETWCRTHHGECTSEFTADDDEIPAFHVTLKDRVLRFRLVKGWPPIIEVRRDDFPDDERGLRLLRVGNNNAWNPPLEKLIDPWATGRPYDGA